MSLHYHNFKEDPIIATDIETKDPHLKDKGPGVYRRDGFVTGVALSNGEFTEYYDIAHSDTTPELKEKNTKYLIDQLGHSNNKIFANALYDLDWLENYENITVNGPIDDIQIAEPLLNENRRSYSLDNLGFEYLKQRKDDSEMVAYFENSGLKQKKGDKAIQNLWRMPASAVRLYGKEDTRLTFEIFKRQKPKLIEQDLWDLYRLETEVLPLLLQMRKQGVCIEMDKFVQLKHEMADLKYDMQEEINEMAGFEININSNKDLEKLFNKLRLPVIYGEPTDKMYARGIFKGNPKFDKHTLKKLNTPIAQKLLDLRHIRTLLSLFMIPYSDMLTSGRLHCRFHPLKSDDYGTVSGRLSSSNPNLQQVSKIEEKSRHELLNGKVIRKLFVPEIDHKWIRWDWSQIEYRLIAHYAMGKGSNFIRERYQTDPNTDYHTELGKITGIDDRGTVKTLNFGAAYGMGIEKMAKVHGWDFEEAEAIYKMYHGKVPFIKETSYRVANKAKQRGYIKTILNRRARLVDKNKAYVMFNRLIQGSSADLMKKAMVDAYKKGLFNVLKPHLTVHDELDCSIPISKEGVEAGMELKQVMESCVSLKVPIIANMEIGDNWGELKEIQELHF